MTDRELLKLAAKAAGITVVDHEYEDWSGFTYRLSEYQKPIDSFNPLHNDGDALRLAVKLNIQVTPRTDDKSEAAHTAIFIEQNNGDPYAATRRAIVRAAAAIGEKL